MFSFSNWNSVIKCKVKGWEISQFCIYNEIIDIHAVDQQISIKLEFDLLKDLSYKSKMEGMPWVTRVFVRKQSYVILCKYQFKFFHDFWTGICYNSLLAKFENISAL